MPGQQNQPVDVAALGMLASAIAGHPLTVRPAPPGQPTHANGHEIMLVPHHDLAAIRQAVACQALLLSIDSLHERGLHTLIGQRNRCQRYMQWELARALARHGQRLPAELEHWLASHAGRPTPSSSQQSLAWAGDSGRAARLPAWPDHLGVIRPAQLTWRQLAGQQLAPLSATTSQERVSALEDDQAEDDPLTSKLLQWFSSPLGGGSLSSLFLKLLGMGAPTKSRGTASTAQGVAAELAGEHQVMGTPSPDARSSLSESPHSTHAPPAARPATQVTKYPEWFEGQGRYKPSWVSVLEMPPAPGMPTSGHAPQHPPMRLAGAAIRRQIARIGIEVERHRAQPDGQDLDLDAMVRQAVDRHRGGNADDRLYEASRRTRRDLSLLILLDVSHSTGDRNQQGLPIIGQQIAMAREITRASSHLGDQVGLYAFHSWGRHLVHCLRIKGLNEANHQGRITQALDSLSPAGMTRMGAAIRHATALMARQAHHSHRVILLLSDGFAHDDQYEGRHAEQDTTKALSEAQAQGVACVCLNIGSQQDDDILKRLYGPAAYLRCADANRAVPALRQLMRHAMASTARHQRTASSRR